MSFRYPKNSTLYHISIKSRYLWNHIRKPLTWRRIHKRERQLEVELGHKPLPGDMFADCFGLRVEDPHFQEAIAYSLEEIGEE